MKRKCWHFSLNCCWRQKTFWRQQMFWRPKLFWRQTHCLTPTNVWREKNFWNKLLIQKCLMSKPFFQNIFWRQNICWRLKVVRRQKMCWRQNSSDVKKLRDHVGSAIWEMQSLQVFVKKSFSAKICFSAKQLFSANLFSAIFLETFVLALKEFVSVEKF